jgi:hypothetical protein
MWCLVELMRDKRFVPRGVWCGKQAAVHHDRIRVAGKLKPLAVESRGQRYRCGLGIKVALILAGGSYAIRFTSAGTAATTSSNRIDFDIVE